ncbi:MAG: hypothetical protein KGL26_10915 [Pseudomonadota bacterium]|nr:hypothetical protein [Pseudomonadota bacterium]
MKPLGKLVLAAAFSAAVAFGLAAPAAAHGDVGVSFGFGFPAYDDDDGYYGYPPYGYDDDEDYGYADPCASYNYYDAPPPWGMPPGYCGYPVYYGSFYWGDTWYRGPVYYRWDGDRRLYWMNHGWHDDVRVGHAPSGIRWQERGGHYGGGHWGGHAGGGHWGGGHHR